MSDVDLAYKILKQKKHPEHYKELIGEVMKQKHNLEITTPQTMASIHTQLNLDHRFHHLGKGQWGLKEWNKGEVKETINMDIDDEYEEE